MCPEQLMAIDPTFLPGARKQNPWAIERPFLSVWSSPLGAGIAAGIVYLLMATLFCANGLGQSPYADFVYLADAFLHGRLDLVHLPANVADLTYYQAHYYLYWPPFPAVVFMPLVALFGTQVSDAALNIPVGGLNVAIFSMLLKGLDERGVVNLLPDKRAWLTAFFAFGTVHLTLAPHASVWYTAQIVSFALLCGAYLGALRLPKRWSPLASGVLVACAFLSRNATLFAAIWIAWFLLRERDRSSSHSFARTALAGLAPICAAAILTGAYNYSRFGSPLEFGISFHLMSSGLVPDYQRYGAFSLHYLPTNLYYNFITVPYLSLLRQGMPTTEFWMGGSLFLMSPVFFLSILGFARSWNTHGRVLAASCLAGMVPMLLIMGTGGWEFGPRYTMDFTVPLLVATAIGSARVSTATIARLTMVSIAVYLPGAILLGLKWIG